MLRTVSAGCPGLGRSKLAQVTLGRLRVPAWQHNWRYLLAEFPGNSDSVHVLLSTSECVLVDRCVGKNVGGLGVRTSVQELPKLRSPVCA